MSGLDAAMLPIGVHSPGYVADTDEQAREELWPEYQRMHDRIGAERGWPPTGRAQFDQEAQRGSLYVGAPRRWHARSPRPRGSWDCPVSI